jgi:hypothetical protein
MLLKIALAFVVLVIAFLITAALSPKTFRVARSATLPVPPSAVFPHVNDLHAWQGWSPWEKLDPNLQRTYEGPAAGVGASYAWTGNNKVGAGRMTVTESRSNELLRIRLEFLKPFAATNTAEFTFTPAGESGTSVTWSMNGETNFICRGLSPFMNMDKMIGASFEQGLASLGQAAGRAAAP